MCYNRSGVVGNFGYQKPRGNWLCPYTAGVTPKLAYQFNDGSGTATGQVPVYLGRDGIYDWLNTIQGVRAYDSDSGSWTTPDAYAGDVHDPMSQKSYVWNKNNSVAYGDPSGYSSMFFDASVGDSGPTGIMYDIPDDGMLAYDITPDNDNQVAAIVGRAYDQRDGAAALQNLGEWAVWAVLMNEHENPDAYHANVYTHFLENAQNVLSPYLPGWKSSIKGRELTFSQGSTSLHINVHDGYVGVHTTYHNRFFPDYSFLQFRWDSKWHTFADASVWKVDAWRGLDNWYEFNGGKSAKVEGAD